MLSTLRIENIAVIEKLELELHEGLNILTGETGAGKSIILKALDLLCGKRLPTGSIRTGAERAVVEALFIVPQALREQLLFNFEVLEDIMDSDELIIRRILDQNGRSKYYLGGSLQPGGVVGQIAQMLIDITGQNEQQSLKNIATQRSLLDTFGVPPELLAEVSQNYNQWKKERDFLEQLASSRQELELKMDRLRLEKEELEEANIETGERERLQEEISRLQNADKIQNSLEKCLILFGESEISQSSSSEKGEAYRLDLGLSELGEALTEAAKYDSRLESLVQIFESVEAELGEIKLQCGTSLGSLDHDPAYFESLQVRLSDLGRMERKYRKNADELVLYLKDILAELSAFDGGIFDEKSLRAREEAARKTLNESESKLSAARKKAGSKLSKVVSEGLKEIELAKASFTVNIETTESGPQGCDAVRFLFTANPGEPLQPLDKVASGGELSRVLLILKSVASATRVGVIQVFDEIDAGVSGAVAQTLGEKLLNIASTSQVLVITHSAQVAALADRHLLVSKENRDDRTFTKVENLGEKERLQSIARMLAGKEVSKQFELSARELLGSRRK